jgi:tagaturonate epimerase
MKLGKYSFGLGDRFSHQGEAQLSAIIKTKVELGIDITPVWNKSNREHTIVHSKAEDTRIEADTAVKNLHFKGAYFVDADHININTVDKFIDSSDFFTLDVADFIGKSVSGNEVSDFLKSNNSLIGIVSIPGISKPFEVTREFIEKFASKYLFACIEASKLYQHIASKKGSGNFITEVSMDEVDEPQSPIDLLFILKTLSDLKVPVQTIAPKFTGRFNKGVDYVGNIAQFEKEFEEDLFVISYCVNTFQLPVDLKLSVHSGSDKFSIYPIMGNLIHKHDKGIHIKTAGTTWLEEMIGLSLGTDESLDLAKAIYSIAYRRKDELCGPYATVIDIDWGKLPTPEDITKWKSEDFSQALQHDASNPKYNLNFRQLIHVGYKVAAEYGPVYTNALLENKDIVNRCVTDNIYERHIRRLFEKAGE